MGGGWERATDLHLAVDAEVLYLQKQRAAQREGGSGLQKDLRIRAGAEGGNKVSEAMKQIWEGKIICVPMMSDLFVVQTSLRI